MKDSTKQVSIIFIPCLIYGFLMGFFGKNMNPEIFLLSVVFLILIMIFLHKKFTPKALKNDEIIKKVAIMSDAIGGRGALIVFFIYMIGDITGYISHFPALETKHWFMILFLGMTIPALIANIYYSNNPDKLS